MIRRFSGLYGAGPAWLVSSLLRESPRVLLVCPDRRTSEDFLSDLQFFTRNTPIVSLPAWDTLPFEMISPQTDVCAERIRALHLLKTAERLICITTPEALSQKTIAQALIDSLSFTIKRSQPTPLDAVHQQLLACGYHQVSLTEEVGEMSIRGGVIDFFSQAFDQPVRLTFSESTIQSIKTFDPSSQRSVNELDQIYVLPVREIAPFHQHPAFHSDLTGALQRIKVRGKELETPPRELAAAIAAVRTGTEVPGIEQLSLIGASAVAPIFESLPASIEIVLFNELACQRNLDTFWELIAEREQRFKSLHELIPARDQIFLSPEAVEKRLKGFSQTLIDGIDVLQADGDKLAQTTIIRTASNLELSTKLKTAIGTGRAWRPLRDLINEVRDRGSRVALVVGSSTREERLKGILADLTLDAATPEMSGEAWIKGADRYPLVILRGTLSHGVQIPSEKLVFIAEQELFPQRSKREGARAKRSLKQLMSSLAQLREGDFIVHQDYGIGRYRGLTHRLVEGVTSDFLDLEYADSVLYLPVQLIGKVQRFSAAEGQVPVLDKLGSSKWRKTKLKVRQSVVTLAGDLIKLYAARSVAKGWRFEPVGAEDERFADTFAYDETPDQRSAIEEVLADMAKAMPMDRLVCGDVGFGKTEVAVRAAFKCTQHARQVAILVPTTILVEQHRQTFEQRFQGYPVKVAAMSRFYTPEENKKTLEGLASGDLDIVVGTHRLLSKDVQFRDLGLVVIDEEHRFGVKHKETLKQLKKSVDVLTLTATPIPRTLHMSLLNIRDISVIETAPLDRRLIRTYVAHTEDALIRDAILRELGRGGQCFFVHNRVQSIDTVTAGLAALVPEARFQFAHGQMSEGQLEAIMQRFLKHEIDVLVSTTIVESGLDIPNANTILIDRADMYGLAQLYQLRGRVGRSDRQAYAYFLIPHARKLGADAQRRLSVLQSLDDLGVGFNLAVRDLEIRGAGNLLGKEQSGSVLAVGYELYTKILREAVLHLKGEEPDPLDGIDPELKLPIEAFIPDHYVPDVSERLVLYQRLAAIGSEAEALELRDEIQDRFGTLPQETERLLEMMSMRSLLRQYAIVKAECSSTKLSLSFSPAAPISADKVLALVRAEPARYRFTKNHTLICVVDQQLSVEPERLYRALKSLLVLIGRTQEA